MNRKTLTAILAATAVVLWSVIWTDSDPGLALVLLAWGCACLPFLLAAQPILIDIANSEGDYYGE